MLPLALFLGFLVLPVLEIYVIIQVGSVIGGWPTVALLLAESLLGAWIMRREGRRAWRSLRETFLAGTIPDRELADAGLVLVGGALLLTPGFITDLFGFLFVLPFTRPLVRRALSAFFARRVRIGQERAAVFPPGLFDRFGPGGDAEPPAPPASPGPVIKGRIVRDDEPRAHP
jgi:UPF0716 protein FxsA